MSNNSVRHFSTIGTRHVDFYLSREGRKRLRNWFLDSFFISPSAHVAFLDAVDTAVNHGGK